MNFTIRIVNFNVLIDFGDIMRIGWAITGAGHLLNESVDALEELAENNEITVFLSNARSIEDVWSL